jgi:ketosteroid isomerase-like protein
MNRIRLAVALPLLLVSSLCFAQQNKAQQSKAKEDALWAREIAYWKYVQNNDLDGYRTLWREDFLGWPNVSPEPARKSHITDWITNHTSKGEHLKSHTLERLTVQVTGDLATTTYRARATWVSKEGTEQSETSRILHTWHRESDGTWQIFSGMSAPVHADGH